MDFPLVKTVHQKIYELEIFIKHKEDFEPYVNRCQSRTTVHIHNLKLGTEQCYQKNNNPFSNMEEIQVLQLLGYICCLYRE